MSETTTQGSATESTVVRYCAGCGEPVENDYLPGGSRQVFGNDGTLYCSSMCLWRARYITGPGLAAAAAAVPSSGKAGRGRNRGR